MRNPSDMTDPLPADLAARLRRAQLVLWAERLVQALWPGASAALLGFALWQFGMPLRVVGLVALGSIALLALGLWRMPRPRRAEAIAHMDGPARPLATLADRLAVGAEDPQTSALWAAHRRRALAEAQALSVPSPAPHLARHDPWALRLIALTMALAALLFADGPRSAHSAGDAPEQIASGPAFELWTRPPAYTGLPGLYLTEAAEEPLGVPAGSEVLLRFYGGAAELTQSVAEGVARRALDAEGGAALIATRSGALVLTVNGRRLAAWDVEIIADTPPQIALAAPPERGEEGRTRLGYEASDDYGVTALGLSVAPDLAQVVRKHGRAVDPDPITPIETDLPLPMAGDRRALAEKVEEDFAAHPLAGLPVRLTLWAEDAAGQRAEASQTAAILPGRRWFVPLAAAIAEQRSDLLWARANGPRVLQMLQALTYRPVGQPLNARSLLIARAAVRRLGYALEDGLDAKEQADLAALLWDLALLIEEGDLASAAERLSRAQDKLEDAIRNGATEEEIARLSDEVRRAMRDYMRHLAQQNPPDDTQTAGDARQVSQVQLDALLEEIERAMREGRTEEAMALMEQLRALMENMQTVQQVPGAGGDSMGAEGEMQDLREDLEEQQDLADDAFRALQDRFRQQRDGTAPDSDDADLAQRQEDLRRGLGAVGDALDGGSSASPEARDALRKAEEAMKGAEHALEAEDFERALEQQAEALEALREGIRAYGRDLRNEAASGGEPPPAAQAEGEGGTDPLGRVLGNEPGTARAEQFNTEELRRRAQELRDEIRRRAGEGTRSEPERNYLRRLLERF